MAGIIRNGVSSFRVAGPPLSPHIKASGVPARLRVSHFEMHSKEACGIGWKTE